MSDEKISRRAEFDGLLLQLERAFFERFFDLPTRAHYRARGIDRIHLSDRDLGDCIGGSYRHWHNLLHNAATPSATDIMLLKKAITSGFPAAHSAYDIIRSSKDGERYICANKTIERRRDGVAFFPVAYHEEMAKLVNTAIRRKPDMTDKKVRHLLEANGLLE